MLSQGSWPISKEVKGAIIPPQIDIVQADFTKYYLSRHQGKILNFVPQMSTSLIFAKFDLAKPGLVKQLEMSGMQAICLLAFNDQEEYTY